MMDAKVKEGLRVVANLRIRRICLVLALSLLTTAQALAQKLTQPAQTQFYFGAAWYPEQWEETRWQSDLSLMNQAGMNVVRIAEFAWSSLEPSEGRFELDWMERAINLAQKNGIRVIVGTPTASPPAWLTQKYPDVLRVSANGQRETHGARAHASFSSEKYRQLCRRITYNLVKRFGSHPNVVGWQVDNEYSLTSAGQDTRLQWHNWLKRRHGSLQNINHRWTTSYWSQTYFQWDQIPLPGYSNPGLALDYKRFVTDTWRAYQKNQLDVLRPLTRAPITTNYMVSFDGFDHFTTAADLDLVSVDYYIAPEKVSPRSGAFLDVVRGLRQKNFWVMETQVGRVDFADINSGHQPGQTRTHTWQSIGHGADMISYWQWRSGRNGQEQYYGTVVGPDGKPRPIYSEVAKIGEELKRAGPLLLDTAPVSDVAMLYSWVDRWAINGQRHHKSFSYSGLWNAFYAAFRAPLTSIDAIAPSGDFSRYKVLVAPALHVIRKSESDALEAWIKAGGHLILGPRSGVKDEFNAFLSETQPGPFANLLGAEVEDYYPLETNVTASGSLGSGVAEIWAEPLRLTLPDTEVLLRFDKTNGWLAQKPAAVSRAVGEGRITYVGFWPDAKLLGQIAKWSLANRFKNFGISAVDPDIEVARRQGEKFDLYIVINHNALLSKPFRLPRVMRHVFTDQDVRDSISILPRDVALLRDDHGNASK